MNDPDLEPVFALVLLLVIGVCGWLLITGGLALIQFVKALHGC